MNTTEITCTGFRSFRAIYQLDVIEQQVGIAVFHYYHVDLPYDIVDLYVYVWETAPKSHH